MTDISRDLYHGMLRNPHQTALHPAVIHLTTIFWLFTFCPARFPDGSARTR